MSGGEHAPRFVALRPLLFTIAYEILGSATDAEDVLQDSFLRFADVDLAGVRDTKSYLAALVTRQSLNALRASARRREDYVGPWLPEPLPLDEQDPSEDVVLAESVSMAMLVVLQTLAPEERAVFVLREVFGFSHDEIATAIGKSTAAVRQIAHRARSHVQARRRRFEPVDRRQSEQLTGQFLATAAGGDVTALMSLLAPDVIFTTDSDGKVSAARRPVSGAKNVARFILGLMGRARPGDRMEVAWCNSAPTLIMYRDDRVDTLVAVEMAEGLITHFYAIRNPDKLGAVGIARQIGR